MQNKENSKQRILDAAVKLFAHKGFDSVSTREICKTANVNLCMISYYFGGKKELFNAIIDDLVEKQSVFVNTFLDLSVEPEALSKNEQISLLYTILDKFIDYFYLSSNISSDLVIFLLKEIQSPTYKIETPFFLYFRKTIAAVFNKNVNSREAIFRTLFIISQMNGPRILPSFSLSLLEQDKFLPEDIEIIRNNVKLYVKLMLKEEGIV